METDWNDLLISFLHDPPDKALDIRGHVKRAMRYTSAALGRPVTENEIRSAPLAEDRQAAIAERLPLPSSGPNGERAVNPEPDGIVRIRHPLSAQEIELPGCKIDPDAVERVIRDLVAGIEDPKQRFLAVWRLLPEKLETLHPWLGRLPADTRVPDHTIWHHCDTAAALHGAVESAHGAAFVSFNLGPVQQFIKAARSVRDLWTGSAILSWITFRAMIPVIERFGPTAVISPSLRGNPLMDLWLRDKKGLEVVPELTKAMRKIPCVPNRFLAVTPWGEGGAIALDVARKCEKAARDAWKEIGDAVRQRLDEDLSPEYGDWARRWDAQMDNFFEICAVALPWREAGEKALAELVGEKTFSDAFQNLQAVRNLDEAIPEAERPRYKQDQAGLWQERAKLAGALMETTRAIRHIPPSTENGKTPPKCSLLGSYEQMGPDKREEAKEFWAAAGRVNVDGTGLKKRECFCAVALTKRFAPAVCFSKVLGLDHGDFHYHDTAKVAAATWLETAKMEPGACRSGQWLHWPRADFDKDDPCPVPLFERIAGARQKNGAPPAYYAVLQMDADNMGKWLRGELAPKVKDIYHPNMQEYFGRLPAEAKGLEEKRPMGPALNAAISEALSNFATRIVPPIVERYKGVLIYAGGDDVLALLPLETAVACAIELRTAFSGEKGGNKRAESGYYRVDGRNILVAGGATISAGLAIVHYKEDLRAALVAARGAEEKAKKAGRDALAIAVVRRSGEETVAVCPWSFAGTVERWRGNFEKKASDRWTYHLKQCIPVFGALKAEAFESEIVRRIERCDRETRETLRGDDTREAKQIIVDDFRSYRSAMEKKYEDAEEKPNAGKQDERIMSDFITLCQSASFMARGRDR